MSTRLRKCLSLVLVTMLLASILICGAFTASAETKTGDGLAAYAMNAYNEGWRYVWGGASYGAVDCSGLIYSYVGGGERTADAMVATATESGYVSDGVPDIPGIGLWQSGHVGVYVGGGMAVDARDEISNVCYSSVSSKNWVMWFKVAGVTYDYTNVTNDAQSDDTDTYTYTSADTDSAEASADSSDEVLEHGDTGSDVNDLQERLKELGYFEDDTTEYFGDYTESCLKEFQEAAGLDSTGVLDEETKLALYSSSAPSKAAESDIDAWEYDTEDTDDSEYDSDDIYDIEEEDDGYTDTEDTNTEDEQVSDDEADLTYQIGDEGDGVVMIQERLIELGFYSGEITGVYDEDTAYAVAQFQLSGSLDATGFVDLSTWDALFNAPIEEAADDTEEEYDTDIDSDSELLEETLEETDSDTDEFPEDAYLAQGMASEEVITMQDRLFELRYTVEEPTGTYDMPTVDAVELFQAVAGYSSTNYITLEQYNLLNSAEAPKSPDYDNLKLGYKGSDVVALQNALVDNKYLNYNSIEQLGVFDETTQKAVMNAQQAMGLEATGTANPEFITKLNAQKEKEQDAQTTNAAVQAANTTSSALSNVSGAVDVPKTGVESLVSKTLTLVVIGVSMLVILFFATLRYWNASMEKRRKRARKAATVSVYRRRYM